MNKISLMTAALITIPGAPLASASWQIGTVAGAEYSSTRQSTTPIVLPWLAYQSRHWQINPLSALHHQSLGPVNWRAGLAFDHAAWSDDWTEVFALITGAEMFAGPLKVDNQVQVTASNPNDWHSRHTVGAMLPLTPGFLVGIETGLQIEHEPDASSPSSTWVNGLQVVSAVDRWRFMALGSWDQKVADSSDTVSAMLSIIYEW